MASRKQRMQTSMLAVVVKCVDFIHLQASHVCDVVVTSRPVILLWLKKHQTSRQQQVRHHQSLPASSPPKVYRNSQITP